MQKFVVICEPRTGSNLLCSILDKNPYVGCHFELFNPNAIYYRMQETVRDKAALATRDGDPILFLEQMYQNAANHRAMGFKLFPSQNRNVFQYCMNATDIKKIILTRENLLAQYSSKLISVQTEQWTAPHSTRPAQTIVNFSKDDFLNYISTINESTKKIEEALKPAQPENSYKVRYAQLADRRTVRMLFKFIRVPNFEISFPPLNKQNTSEILDRFSNPTEALDTLNELGKPAWANETVAMWRANRFKKLFFKAMRRLGGALKNRLSVIR